MDKIIITEVVEKLKRAEAGEVVEFSPEEAIFLGACVDDALSIDDVTGDNDDE